MVIYFGVFYIFLGITFLLIPLVYIELGRPKDLIRSCLNLIVGLIFIFKNKVLENSYPSIYYLTTIMVAFYVVEIFTNRWNQLTDNEQIKLTTIVELKKNLVKISDAFSLAFQMFANAMNFLKFDKTKESLKKKWVRNDKNDKIKV